MDRTDLNIEIEHLLARTNNDLTSTYYALIEKIDTLKNITPPQTHEIIDDQINQLDSLFQNISKTAKTHIKKYISHHIRSLLFTEKNSRYMWKKCIENHLVVTKFHFNNQEIYTVKFYSPNFKDLLSCMGQTPKIVSLIYELERNQTLCRQIYLLQKNNLHLFQGNSHDRY